MATVNINFTYGELKFLDDNTIEFGCYPRTLKDKSVFIGGDVDSNGFHLGSDGFLYLDKNNMYFKIEPIVWNILHRDNKEAVIFTKDIIDCQIYNSGKYPFYGKSDYRKWLNNVFIKTAFLTKKIQDHILPSDVKYGFTRDKVFPLRYTGEIETIEQADRIKFVTDYAYKMRCYRSIINTTKDNGIYWLRDTTEFITYCINEKGELAEKSCYSTDVGVVPALKIKLD